MRKSAESKSAGFIITDETEITANMKLSATLKELQINKEYRRSAAASPWWNEAERR